MADMLDGSEDDGDAFTEAIERSWRVYLTNFKNDVFPMFVEYGMNFSDALMAWELNRLKNAVNKLSEEDDD